jgi:nucleoside-diphosphate-sugar epimerase
MILLTGATGYLGSEIARLLIERGEPFRVFVRHPAQLGFDPSSVHCEVVMGDLRDQAAIERALEGARQVIHTAALVKMWTPVRDDYWRVNLDGLKALLRAAASAGVERVVYTSSFIALGPSGDPSTAPGRGRRAFSNEYEETKSQALVWLREQGFRQFPIIALCPGVIYGPGPRTEGNLIGNMMDQYLAGKFPGLLGTGEQCWSFSFNEDVARAHLAALEKGRLGKEYVLAGDNRSLNEFFRILSEVSGVYFPIRHLPFFVGKIAGAVHLARAELFGRSPQITPGIVKIFKQHWAYSSEKAQSELGYRVTRLEDGLRKTLAVDQNTRRGASTRRRQDAKVSNGPATVV